MKICEETLSVLKNFAGINQSLFFKSGNLLRTIAPQKNILAQAKISENLPKDFGIYDLNQFLGLESLFECPDFKFNDNYLIISENDRKSRYTYTDKEMIIIPPEKNINLPSEDVKFFLAADQYKSILDAANQLQLPEIVVRTISGGSGLNVIEIAATDVKDTTSNEYSLKTTVTTNATFNFIFRTDNMKFMQDDYNVTIASGGISHFKGGIVQYWVATESGSVYNEGV